MKLQTFQETFRLRNSRLLVEVLSYTNYEFATVLFKCVPTHAVLRLRSDVLSRTNHELQRLQWVGTGPAASCTPKQPNKFSVLLSAIRCEMFVLYFLRVTF